jgi:hypothetical protein
MHADVPCKHLSMTGSKSHSTSPKVYYVPETVHSTTKQAAMVRQLSARPFIVGCLQD